MFCKPVLCAFVVLGITSVAQAQPAAHTVVFDGAEGTDGTWYKIGASERLEQVSGMLGGHQVTVNENDTVRGTSARGFVGSGKDGYRVWGDIIALELENDAGATIYVDGKVYQPQSGSNLTFGLGENRSIDLSQIDRSGADRSKGGRYHPSAVEGGEEELIACIVARRRGEANENDACGGEGDSEESSGSSNIAPDVNIPEHKPSGDFTKNSRRKQLDLLPAHDAKPKEKESEKDISFEPVVVPIDGYVLLPEGGSEANGENGSSGDKADKGREVHGAGEIAFAGGEPTRSAISGRAGDNTHSFEFGTRALSQVGWRERFDKPCRLNLLSRVDGEQLWARILDRCGHSDTFACETETCKTDYLAIDQTHEASITGRRPAITALRVCTNDRKNGRVKGVEVRGGEILDDGSVSTTIETASDTLPHCRKWEPLVLCPSGAVATGLRAHFDPGKGTSRNVEQLVGLQLVCRSVSQQ